MVRVTLALILTTAATAAAQVEAVPERGDPSVKLPLPEARVPLDGSRLAVVRGASLSWQLVSGAKVLRDFGQDLLSADDTCRAMRDLRATQWVAVGTPPALEYGLTEGKAAVGVPRRVKSVPLDASTRVERLRGVWVLRTATTIVANFGGDRASAEQAIAAIQRYGFDRAGRVGADGHSTFLYYSGQKPDEAPAPSRNQALALAAIGETLSRTGVNVPGTEDYAGERVVIDPRQAEVRRDGLKFSLVCGTQQLAAFGNDEWSARDALNAVQDGQFTEVCRVAGATFYLSHGRPPSQVGLGAKRTRFDARELQVRPQGRGFALVAPGGFRLAATETRDDADLLLRVVRGYEFDTVCECGGGRRGGLVYWARTGR